MGLYNPILGDIPQPNNNSSEVPFITKTNYGGTTIVVPDREVYSTFLTTQSLNPNVFYPVSATTTEEFVLTGLFIKEYLAYNVGDVVAGTFQAFTNGSMIYNTQTIKVIGAIGAETGNLFIPIDNLTFNKGAQFLIQVRRDGGLGGTVVMEALFIGYKRIKN